MKDRLLKLISTEGISPAKLAEIIGVQRSSVSHMLSGRNNPSYDVLQSILQKFPKVNPDWLLLGKGDMFRKPVQASLFDWTESTANDRNQKTVEKSVEHVHDQPIIPRGEVSKTVENSISEKIVERVVVFFKDNTFKEYKPE